MTNGARSRRRWTWGVALLTAGVLAGVATVASSHPGPTPSGVIHTCFKTNGGDNLRVVSATTTCDAKDTALEGDPTANVHDIESIVVLGSVPVSGNTAWAVGARQRVSDFNGALIVWSLEVFAICASPAS